MDPSRPAFPMPVRALNAGGRALRRLGLPLLRLDPDALRARAARATGLGDFGDDDFRAPLQLLCDALEDDAAGLTALGRIVARRELQGWLENRLRLVDGWTRHPDILAQPVRQPLFILGLPRTGTSILHELLAQDPANRVPMTWEVRRPWPPAERATADTDPRIAAEDAQLAGIDRLIPGFKRMHPMGARLPQECVVLQAHAFRSLLWPTTHHVPRYADWLETADHAPAYAWHRRMLQTMQWRCPAARWVCKSPGHLWTPEALLAAYPDARVVQTHRDPLKVVASLTSLVTLLRSLAAAPVDPTAVGAEWTARLHRGLERTMAARRAGTIPADRVLDVRFPDLLRDEIGMVRRIYDWAGWALTADAEARMRAFLAANRADKHGKHRYTLAAAGLDLATERRRYAAYQAAHELASEPVA